MTVLLLLQAARTRGQSTARPYKTRASAGITIGQSGDDPAIGIEVCSPPLLTESLRLRLQMNRTWLEAYKATRGHWAAYTTGWLGGVYTRPLLEQVNGSCEAGLYQLFTNGKFSTRRAWPGYYAACGAELHALDAGNQQTSFLFSVGYAYTRAKADKIEDEPTYGRGIFFRLGLRYYFQ
jgi:hypothetical protein